MHTRMPDTAPGRGAEADARPTARGTAFALTRQHTAASMPLLGRLAVEFLDHSGPGKSPLNQRPAGTLVSATGMVTALHVLDSVELPHLVVTLSDPAGGSARCSVDADHYFDLCSYLYDGTEVQISGKVRRPANGRSPLIDALTVRPARSTRQPDHPDRTSGHPPLLGPACVATGDQRRPLLRTSMVMGGAR
ncbi:hypothetical protein ACFXKF_32360 [Streptomyces scopuliridis]|uniref:hypothetical protein n=1 Tax=Streptomyces scopuliridis TaxID=452529 RepID=UPI0036CCF6A2